jgi:murein DD-endopeptidase MepM/ murein hydrolase activator NlpD
VPASDFPIPRIPRIPVIPPLRRVPLARRRLSPERLALIGVAVLALGSLGSRSARTARTIAVTPDDAENDESGALSASCPPGTLPDGDVCVHLPTDDEPPGDAPLSAENTHRERSGRWAVYEQIPRRPDRPADYDAYRYPVPAGLPGGHFVVSGYDLDRPNDSQRRGRTLRAVGHGGVDLPDPRGTPVAMVPLDHQVGDADVVYVGPLFGTTVVTRHTVREAGRLRDYVLLFGHLDGVAPGLAAGQPLKEGEVLGFVGDTGSPELIHLHLEARRVRDGVDIAERIHTRSGGSLLDSEATVVCDPRNILPLR